MHIFAPFLVYVLLRLTTPSLPPRDGHIYFFTHSKKKKKNTRAYYILGTVLGTRVTMMNKNSNSPFFPGADTGKGTPIS